MIQPSCNYIAPFVLYIRSTFYKGHYNVSFYFDFDMGYNYGEARGLVAKSDFLKYFQVTKLRKKKDTES